MDGAYTTRSLRPASRTGNAGTTTERVNKNPCYQHIFRGKRKKKTIKLVDVALNTVDLTPPVEQATDQITDDQSVPINPEGKIIKTEAAPNQHPNSGPTMVINIS